MITQDSGMQPRSWIRALTVTTTILSGSFLFASGLRDLALARLLEAVPTASSSYAPRDAAPSSHPRTPPDPHVLLARNVFDYTTGPLWPPSAEATASAPSSKPAEPPRCEIETRMAAAFYNARAPERSWVVLRGPRIGPGRPYTRGMQVADLTVAQIRPEAVLLQRAESSCWLGMFNERSRTKIARERAASEKQRLAQARSRAASKPRASRRPPPPFSAAELKASIEKLDENRFQLARPLLEKARERSLDIASTTRFAPARADGRLVGMRLLRMRSGGLLSHLGLRRGDVLRTINGYPIAETDALLGAYAGVLRSTRITLALERGLRLMTLEYYVR